MEDTEQMTPGKRGANKELLPSNGSSRMYYQLAVTDGNTRTRGIVNPSPTDTLAWVVLTIEDEERPFLFRGDCVFFIPCQINGAPLTPPHEQQPWQKTDIQTHTLEHAHARARSQHTRHRVSAYTQPEPARNTGAR